MSEIISEMPPNNEGIMINLVILPSGKASDTLTTEREEGQRQIVEPPRNVEKRCEKRELPLCERLQASRDF